MARIRLAREIAAATGRNLTEATRFIQQVGPTTARRALRGAEARTTWRLPALAATGTGGVLLWRRQHIAEAEAIADQSQNTMEALALIMESDDLTAEQKTQLAEDIANQGNGSSDNGLLAGIGGDLQTTIIMIVVLLVVLSFAANYASNLGMPAGSGRVR